MTKNLFRIVIIVCNVLLIAFSLFSQELQSIRSDPETEKFEKRLHPFQDMTLPYRLFIPDSLETSHFYPLVLALHGAGERGTDNEIQIMLHRLAFTWSDSASQAKWPCFVVVPQCPANQSWGSGSSSGYLTQPFAAVMDLLDSIMYAFPVDTNRIYVTGLSMGGYGTYECIFRFPQRFAAAVPMSGGGNPNEIESILDVPIWIFHGASDQTVPVSESRNIVTAYINAGRSVVYTHCNAGVCNLDPIAVMDSAVAAGATHLYTEYAGGGHVTWAESYNLPQLHQWIFMQSLDNSSSISDRDFNPISKRFSLSQNYPNPFNSTTIINYQLPAVSNVLLKIYDVLGREISILVNGLQETGFKTVHWDARVPSGLYFYRLEAVSVDNPSKRFVDVKKLLLLK